MGAGGGRAGLERIAGPDFNLRADGRRFHPVRIVSLVAAGVRAKAISGSKVDLREYELADLYRGAILRSGLPLGGNRPSLSASSLPA